LRWSLICILGTVIIISSSCATVFCPKPTECQRTKPKAGEPSRQVRIGALVCDIVLFWPGLIVDFIDYKIYKPCKTVN
jgi:hypothetical protein